MICHAIVKYVKKFLDYVEDSMSRDSLIRSAISSRPRKNISCISKVSSSSVLSNDVKASEVSEKANPHDFYPKNLNHAFLPKPDFEGYRNNAKKDFENNQDYLDEELHQESDHPSTFMKTIKGRIRAMSAANDTRH
jgi:hypothetical protein